MSEIDSVPSNSGYRLVSLIGEGSRSRVYLAEESSQASRKLAVKFLREDEFPEAETATKHLNHEAHCLTLSAHANVVHKLNQGTNESGRPFLVTEYLPGKSLKQLLAEAPPDAASLVSIIMQVCSALENMHKIGVLHLDLRPDKLIIEQSKKDMIPKLIGFGRCKFLPWAGREQPVEPLPKQGIYSLQYASPEQAMDKRCLPASDVYSLGCIFYEGLTGRPPIQGENELHVMAQHISGKIPPPSVLKGDNSLKKYDEVTMQALAALPHQRFVDAPELREALARLGPSNWMARLFKK